MKAKPSDRFAAWLEAELASREPGARLPSARAMAEPFGISKTTVLSVLGRFEREGSIRCIHGKGVFVGGPEEDEPVTVSEPEDSAGSIVAHIGELIHTGAIREGDALPPIKTLVLRFRVAPATVSKAYRELARRGYAVRVGKTYWIGGFERLMRQRTSREVFLFAHETYEYDRVFHGDLFDRAYRRFDTVLQDHGFALRFENTVHLRERLRSWSRAGRGPHALVFHRWEPDATAALLPFLERFLRRPAGRGVRMLAHWHGNGPVPTYPRGAYLLSRGYLYQVRTRAFVRFLVQERARKPVFLLRRWPAGSGGLLWRCRRVVDELNRADPDMAPALAIIEPHKHLPKAGTVRLRRNARTGLLDQVKAGRRLRSTRSIDRLFLDGFDEVFELPGVAALHARHSDRTLWVCLTSDDAAGAYTAVRERGLRVPEDVMIAQLGSKAPHYHMGIRECDADMDRIGYLMAHAVIGDIPVKRTRDGLIALEASIRPADSGGT